MLNYYRYLLVLLIFVFIKACSPYTKETPTDVSLLYAEALHYIYNDNLEKAKLSLKKITDDYPFKEEALEAQIFLIWIYYIQNDLVSAEITIDEFLRYYIYNEYTQWVNYMNALVKYESTLDIQKDSTYTNEAFVLFSRIMNNQNSLYSKDARFRIEAIKYLISQKNMMVGYYYLSNKNYIAAISRYTHVVRYYYDTVFVEEAMYRLVYLWLILGEEEEAFRVVAVLGYNYPHSEWFILSERLIKTHTTYTDDFIIERTRD